jgi:Lrp/AsnC family leucine-responsive transcriptional regulator
MEKLDRKILLELAEDSRKPIYEIAKKVGVSRQTVAKRIERLRLMGVRFTIDSGPLLHEFGLRVKAYIMMRLDPRPEVRKSFEEKIKVLPQIAELHYLLGPKDAVLKVFASSDEEIGTLVKKLHELPGVRETETFLVHGTVKEERSLLDFLLREG